MRLLLSCIKKTFILIAQREISLRDAISVYADMYRCGREYFVSTSVFANEKLFKQNNENVRQTILTNSRENHLAEIEERKWQEGFWNDKAFFAKWTSLRYDSNSKAFDKRRIAYCTKFDMPDDVYIGPNVIFRNSHYIKGYTPMLKIGHHVKFVENVFIDWTGRVNVGDNVTLANGVIIESHNRDIEALRKGDDVNIPREINIKNGVYIGSRAVILSSCHEIGENSVIAANAVVTKDVPSNSLVAGIPAKIIKMYTFDENIESLNRKKNVMEKDAAKHSAQIMGGVFATTAHKPHSFAV